MTYERWKRLRWIILGPFFGIFSLGALFSLGYALLLSKHIESGYLILGHPLSILRLEAHLLNIGCALSIPMVVFEITSAFLMKRRKKHEDYLGITTLNDAKNTWPPTPTLPL